MLVFMNLPRHLRFKRENVLLVGILPGPNESSHDINTFLQPLVDELNKYLTGVNMKVHGYGTEKLVKRALLCGSCDIPNFDELESFSGYRKTAFLDLPYFIP